MYIYLKRIFIFIGVVAAIVLLTLMLRFGQEEREELDATWNKLNTNDSILSTKDNEIQRTERPPGSLKQIKGFIDRDQQ